MHMDIIHKHMLRTPLLVPNPHPLPARQPMHRDDHVQRVDHVNWLPTEGLHLLGLWQLHGRSRLQLEHDNECLPRDDVPRMGRPADVLNIADVQVGTYSVASNLLSKRLLHHRAKQLLMLSCSAVHVVIIAAVLDAERPRLRVQAMQQLHLGLHMLARRAVLLGHRDAPCSSRHLHVLEPSCLHTNGCCPRVWCRWCAIPAGWTQSEWLHRSS